MPSLPGMQERKAGTMPETSEARREISRCVLNSTVRPCADRMELERVVGACITGILRTALAIEENPSITRLVEVLDFYRDRERAALEVLATHRKLHGC